ncbi:MAG: enolase [Patescibacteria group bacterium]|nr:enolase [Patescibacteria group bacterium]
MSKIQSIEAKEIKDSRGNPTIEVEIKSGDFLVKAGVPSGASTGKLEAKVIDVAQAIKNVNEIIGPQLIGKDPCEQKKIDDFLIELDSTENKSNLGANAILGVSIAVAKLGAKINNLSLWQHISNLSEIESHIPFACFNIINGGAHAENDLDIQEFMIVPQHKLFSENFQIAKDIYQSLENTLKGKFGEITIGDEGGFAPPISSINEALNLITQANERIDADSEKTKIILDCAASQFEDNSKYQIEKFLFSKEELLNFYSDLISQYPIIGLEDPFEENDWQGFQLAYNNLGDKVTIIGDDLLVTNPKRIKEAAEKTACNGAIIKVNQIGTVSEAIEAVKLAKSYSWKIMVSHRSGETLDDFIADFAVGVGADFIKSGAPATPERLSKYNRLLEIEKEIINKL